MVSTLGTFTPYSSVLPIVSGSEDSKLWAPPPEQDRLNAYQKYEELYWNNPTAFRLETRGDLTNPLYIPNPMAICDMTAHFVMKGMKLVVDNEADQAVLDKFCKREKFYTRFTVAKHSGVVRGDYVFHIWADPTKAPGARVSLVSVDPGSFFPVWDEDDPDKVLGVDLVDTFIDNSMVVKVKRQRYIYRIVQGQRRIETSLMLFEPGEWWKPEAKPIKVLVQPKLLPESIKTIPVYHFKNIDWQGQDFGSSELRGFERILAGINQSSSDEDVALSLEGLGVYATDAPAPTDADGNEEDWNVAPGVVLEIPSGSKFERVTGVGSVKPFQDHLKYLTSATFEGSGTFRPAEIEAQIAQSGIALAIKFLPTMAKCEQREEETIGVLQQMWYDWSAWQVEYENASFSTTDFEVEITLGDKLPKNKSEVLNELNNALDRKVISKEYYRQMLTEHFGYTFPDNIAQEILDEQEAVLELQQQFTPVQPNGSGGNGGGVSDQSGTKNRSNNKNRTNESNGTEATK